MGIVERELEFRVDKDKYKDVLIIVPYYEMTPHYVNFRIDKKETIRVFAKSVYMKDGYKIVFSTEEDIRKGRLLGRRFKEVEYYGF